MMNDKNLDDFLRAYQSETEEIPSRHVRESILAVPGRAEQNPRFSFARPWQWFDLMIPRAVGWALTCGMGIYLGLAAPEPGFAPTDDEYYLYDQAQVLLSEDPSEAFPENMNGEEID